MLHKFREDILWQTISVALIYVYTVHYSNAEAIVCTQSVLVLTLIVFA